MKYILAVIVLLVLYRSNPSLEDHQAAVNAKINQVLRSEISSSGKATTGFQQLGMELGVLLGGSLLDNLVKEVIKRKDYFFFSLTSYEFNGNNRIIGVGMLGAVFISDEVQKELQQRGDQLKEGIGSLWDSGEKEKVEPAAEEIETPEWSNDYFVNASEEHPVYVYNAPEANSSSDEYYDSRVRITALNEENGYVQIEYHNSKNESASGWIAKEQLEKVQN